MKELVLTDSRRRRLPFYLAVEEWAARRLPADDYFFAWRVEPTVICGRNQDMAQEVDMDFCRRNGIDVVRRRSGGGCVLADMDNLMFSYITPGDEVSATFSRYTTLIASMLAKLGFEAEATGRNDILVKGRKVAGNAFYHLPGRCIVHGTMLLDFTPDLMAGALTPSRAKMASKAVKSVPSRITGLRAEGLKMTVEEFRAYALEQICDGKYCLSADDVHEIEEIEKAYYEPSFLNRKCQNPEKPKKRCVTRIEGVGEFEADLTLDSEKRIVAVNLSGDFFVTGDMEENIFRHLRGCGYTAVALRKALLTTTPGNAVPGLEKDHLLTILTNCEPKP